MAADVPDDELTAAIQAVRDRVRARHPQNGLGLEGVAAANLLPLVQARDAAEAKVAAIGTVNPRPPGLKNNIAQWIKRKIARALDWHVREQVEFNRAATRCVQSTLEALSETNRALAALAAHNRTLREDMATLDRAHREEMAALYREAQELKDIRIHWAEWRAGFEERRAQNEIHLLRTVSELQGAFQHRVTLQEQNFRETARQQHREFNEALDRAATDIQKRLWADLEEIRAQYEKLIHNELKVIRQKAVASPVAGPAGAAATEPAVAPIHIDWLRFAENFRGPEEKIRERQRHYVLRFAGSAPVLDLGCGRGEFLEAARDAGLAASGIDLSDECVALCRAKGLHAEKADLFGYLDAQADQSLGGIYCSQVVEHIDPHRLPDLIALMAKKMRPGALAIIETPNPECLAIFATHFFLDPTHTRPVPPALLGFYMEDAGFGRLEIERISPAVESMPVLAELPKAVREKFFGGLDYVIYGRKL
ncbi:MAG TPA: methyltransferase domain-containing protein [Bryobacteraceae bacterium]|nr:methyltransferase domain-containing protein [Bryobacteraceae bacterium]